MNVQDIPADYDKYESFNREYERKHFRFAESNARVGAATREMFVRWFPRFLGPLVRRTIHALLDDPLLEAFGFPRPAPWFRGLVVGSLRLRSGLARLLPARRLPRRRTQMKRAVYPHGYIIEELGPTVRAADSNAAE